jgi:hypothetical protein
MNRLKNDLSWYFTGQEGKGRFSKKEFIQFLYYARGSLFETITLIEIFKQKNWIETIKYESIRKDGDEIGKMLSSLIKSIKNNIWVFFNRLIQLWSINHELWSISIE